MEKKNTEMEKKYSEFEASIKAKEEENRSLEVTGITRYEKCRLQVN